MEPREDPESIRKATDTGMRKLLLEATHRLTFPICVMATCRDGIVMAYSVAKPGDDPQFDDEVQKPTFTFPVTFTATGSDGGKVFVVVAHPNKEPPLEALN